MIDILIIFLILSFLVLIHEAGHYIVAKKTGVHVEEFGFGYPPRAKVLFTKGGTKFTMNWLPFGGFVKLMGDEGESFEGKESTVIDSKKSFSEKSAIIRLLIIVAGAFVNVLFGIFAFAVIYSQIGIPTRLKNPVIAEVTVNTPAAQADIRPGDYAQKMDGVEILSSGALLERIGMNRGKRVMFELKRGDEVLTKEIYIRTLEETPQGEGSLGIAFEDTVSMKYPMWQMPFRGMVQGTKDSYAFALTVLNSLKSMVVNMFVEREVPKDISGPIGIVVAVHKEQTFKQGGFLTILNMAALISINLGVVNLLPIPALDGGRALFVFLEKIIGKKRRAKAEGYANMVGMFFLLGLIILISIKDVVGIFR